MSQAFLQSRKTEAGSIARLSAPDVEALVYKAVKEVLRTDQTDNDITDRELISQHVERVMVHADRIAVTLWHSLPRLDRFDESRPKGPAAVADGEAPIGLTVSGLARSLPHKWIDQERMFGLS